MTDTLNKHMEFTLSGIADLQRRIDGLQADNEFTRGELRTEKGKLAESQRMLDKCIKERDHYMRWNSTLIEALNTARGQLLHAFEVAQKNFAAGHANGGEVNEAQATPAGQQAPVGRPEPAGVRQERQSIQRGASLVGGTEKLD